MSQGVSGPRRGLGFLLWQKFLGSEHPDMLTSVNNLGSALYAAKYEEAEGKIEVLALFIES